MKLIPSPKLSTSGTQILVTTTHALEATTLTMQARSHPNKYMYVPAAILFDI